MRTSWAKKLLPAAGVMTLSFWATPAFAATCLTTGTDQVGDAAFGATVQTFINAGIDPNVTCIENSLWSDPSNFGLGNFVGGAEGYGGGPTLSEQLSYNGDNLGSAAANADGRDFYWVQDNSSGSYVDFGNGIVGGAPSKGLIWDLGGQANQAVVFVSVDHGPVPGEVLENSVWLSNDPNAADGDWTQAFLTHVYGYGWSMDPDNDGIPDINDGFAVVYTLPDANATFRYVSVTWGGPGAIHRDGDNEIDAVGGLTREGEGVGVPEPVSLLLLGTGLAGFATRRRMRRA